MISSKTLATALEGLSILPAASGREYQPHHYALLLRLLNERSVQPPPTDAELDEAAMRHLASAKFFPAPQELIARLQEVRAENETEARKQLSASAQERWETFRESIEGEVKDALPPKPEYESPEALASWAARAQPILDRIRPDMEASCGFRLELEAMASGKTAIRAFEVTDAAVRGAVGA